MQYKTVKAKCSIQESTCSAFNLVHINVKDEDTPKRREEDEDTPKRILHLVVAVIVPGSTKNYLATFQHESCLLFAHLKSIACSVMQDKNGVLHECSKMQLNRQIQGVLWGKSLRIDVNL